MVYYRSGHGPEHYRGEGEWGFREKLEMSTAVKVPSLPAQLAGCKKVQQLWYSHPQRYVKNIGKFSDEGVKALLEVMAEQVDLADPGSQVLVERAKTLPDGYVLKPQREGDQGAGLGGYSELGRRCPWAVRAHGGDGPYPSPCTSLCRGCAEGAGDTQGCNQDRRVLHLLP